MAAIPGGRRRRALTIALLLVASIGVVGSLRAQDQDFLDYEPGSVAPGDALRVFGRSPEDCGDLQIHFFLNGVLLDSIFLNDDGSFDTVLEIPEDIPEPEFGTPNTLWFSCNPDGTDQLAVRTLAITAPPAEAPEPEDSAQEGPALQSVVPFFDAEPTGPPGMRLVLVGSMQRECDDIYLFFDGERSGEGVVHQDNRSFSSGRLKVPYDASKGEHTITSSCDRSGDPVEGSLPFVVDPGAPDQGLDHRSLFSRSVPGPFDISREPGHILRNLLLALLFLALILFPAELFNSTLEEHYEEVKGWLGPIGRFFGSLGRVAGGMPGWLALVLFSLVAAVIYGFLDPEFGRDRDSVVILAGMLLGIVAISLAFDLPSIFFVRARHGIAGSIKVLPGTLLVAVLCVVISRLVEFQPGYFYGAIAGTLFAGSLTDEDDGRATAIGAAVMFVISLAAWFVWIPIREAVGDPQATIVVLILDVALATIFVAGLESMIFGMIPMRNLDGESVIRWSKIAWALLFGLGVFGFVHVLLNPFAGYIDINPAGFWTGALLFGAFGLFSLSFWAYFRFKGGGESPGTPVG